MSKRLQVLLEPAELREIQRSAKRARMTVAEWVRQALRATRKSETEPGTARKLRTITHAATHQFPAPDIAQMLAEIERGYQRTEL